MGLLRKCNLRLHKIAYGTFRTALRVALISLVIVTVGRGTIEQMAPAIEGPSHFLATQN